MVASGAVESLRTERTRLEDEITRLRSRLAVAERRVIRVEARGAEPRGFMVGLLVGALLVAGAIAALFLMVMSALGHTD
jgi:hypothetical protein